MEVMTDALIKGLAGSKTFIVKHLDTQVSSSLAEKSGSFHLKKSLRFIPQVLRFLLLLSTFSPHIVYTPLANSPRFLGFMRDLLFVMLSVLAGKKVMVRLHGGRYFYANSQGMKRRLVRLILRRVDLAMVQGHRLTSVFNGLIPAERISVVPNGLDDKGFVDARRRGNGRNSSPGPRRILFVGFMCEEKGFMDVISTIPLVPDAVFQFAGEWGSEDVREKVQIFLKQHKIEDRVDFRGIVTGDVKFSLFVSSDIFVFPTYFPYEGHAVCSVEALAAGLPIVCTDHGALNESVTQGWNGLFVRPSDPIDIACKLNELVADDAMRKTMGERSRMLYEERFTLDSFVRNWSEEIKKSYSRFL
jgi:glycosyltransferase involved in cell wall biosynthesis